MTSASNHLLGGSPRRVQRAAIGLAGVLGLLLVAQHSLAQSIGGTVQGSTSVATPAPVQAPAPSAAVAAAPLAAAPAPVTADAVPAGPIGRDAQPWALTHRGYNTWGGSTGGLFVDDPGMAQPGSVRVQLGLDFFSGKNFLYHGDKVQQDRQTLSLSWTALDILEFYAAMQSQSTVASLPESNTLTAFGDLALGFKVGSAVGKVVRLGGGLRLNVPSGVGRDGISLSTTSFDIRGGAAIDLQGLDSPVPFIVRLNLDYLVDQSANLITNIESSRYDALQNPVANPNAKDEVRNLVSRVERFGLGINRVDMFTLGLGFEVPVEVSHDFYLHPMLDYRIGVPVNRQAYDCAFSSKDTTRGKNALGPNKAYPDDTCIADAGAKGSPMNLALGVRIVPPVRGLAVTLGIDFGLTGTSTFVRELAANAPLRGMLGLSYDYDARPPPPVVVPPPPPPPPPPPAKGRLLGRVTDQATGQPIADVVLHFVGSSLTPLATDETGHFTSYELDPGDAELTLSHPDYEPRRCAATIPAPGGDVDMSCSLSALPTAGSVKGSLRDQYGASVAGARVQLTGLTTVLVTSDPAGDFVANDLAPGDYTARVESESQLIRVVRLNVEPRKQTRIEIATVSRPAKSGVSRKDMELVAKNLKFASGSVDFTPAAAQAVAEVADYLMRDPSTRRLRIESDGKDGLALSRALAIKQRIVDAGVSDARLEAVPQASSHIKLSIVD